MEIKNNSPTENYSSISIASKKTGMVWVAFGLARLAVSNVSLLSEAVVRGSDVRK